jgi:hypothetical protein
MNIFSIIKRFVFGYDIFISYSRKDSLDYAYSIARHFMKNEYGYDCYIDQLSSTNPGKDLPASIKSALKSSTAFIIIGSEAAMNSKPISEEIVTFRKLKGNNPIIPIDIDGRIFLSEWYPAIEGLAVIDEDEESFYNKQASAATLERIHNSLSFTKKSQKLRRTAIAFLSFFVVSILLTAFMYIRVGAAKKELEKTSRQIRQEQMQGLIYLSKINAPANTIAALKYALKAYTDYRDVDTSNVAEKNLLDLYNNHNVIIKNEFWTGGNLTPGGKYIKDVGGIYSLSTKRQLFYQQFTDIYISPDDEIAAVSVPGELKLYHLPDTLLLNTFSIKDSFAFAEFDAGNQFVFITTQADINNDTAKAKVRVFDRKTNKINTTIEIPAVFRAMDYHKASGGILLLQNYNEINKGSYILRISSGIIEQLPVENKPNCLLINHSFEGDNLLLEQTVTNKKGTGIFKSTNYNFRIRLLNTDGEVLEDSTYIYTDIFNQEKNTSQEKNGLYTSKANEMILFGKSGFWGVSFLLNTFIRPLQTPERLHFGSLMKSYEFVKLISDEYILAVGYKNDEYTITVFKIANQGIKEIFSTVNKNHPNGSLEDDSFMKSIDISYNAKTNFLSIYDRGEGWCTQYYLDKKPIGTAQEFHELILKKRLFAGIWNE